MTCEQDETLNDFVGKYVKAREIKAPLSEVSRQILKSPIGVFEKFNSTRNNDSLAHDNELLKRDEALFIFESVVTILRFVKRTEDRRYGV